MCTCIEKMCTCTCTVYGYKTCVHVLRRCVHELYMDIHVEHVYMYCLTSVVSPCPTILLVGLLFIHIVVILIGSGWLPLILP